MALAANDADDRVQQLLVLTDRLTDLLAAETRAFEARRPQDAAATSEETMLTTKASRSVGPIQTSTPMPITLVRPYREKAMLSIRKRRRAFRMCQSTKKVP